MTCSPLCHLTLRSTEKNVCFHVVQTIPQLPVSLLALTQPSEQMYCSIQYIKTFQHHLTHQQSRDKDTPNPTLFNCCSPTRPRHSHESLDTSVILYYVILLYIILLFKCFFVFLFITFSFLFEPVWLFTWILTVAR